VNKKIITLVLLTILAIIILSFATFICSSPKRETPDPFEALKNAPNFAALERAQSKIYDIGQSAVPHLVDELDSITNAYRKSVAFSLISVLDPNTYCKLVIKKCQEDKPDVCSMLRGASPTKILQVSDTNLLREMTNTLAKRMGKIEQGSEEYKCIKSFFEGIAFFDHSLRDNSFNSALTNN
jgi:hypothetical protein